MSILLPVIFLIISAILIIIATVMGVYLLCRFALERLQMPPHSPNIAIKNLSEAPEIRENTE
jgi:hypothetical protein